MKKIAVVYWSGTGNTEQMARQVAAGAQEAGAEAEAIAAAWFSASQVGSFDAIAFGCPAMGAEELEADEFAPMFEACLPQLRDKPIALFGSYGWGDGEWMRSWEGSCVQGGAILAAASVICQEAPDEEADAACKALGRALAGS
ncbi:MAG: flavodoxin [Oscillospiraceae bacterium]|jgi:flavodoxin I|nr:MAG: flavodoxin [Firmicutes bacterium CAG:137_57_8]